MGSNYQQLQEVLDKAVDRNKVFGTSFCIRHGGNEWCGASGDLEVNQQYFIASTTKLFVTAAILKYRSVGLLSLDDGIGKHLPQHIISGLHVLKGKDHSEDITIRHLLAHTSGLPDYFQGKDGGGDSLEKLLKTNTDKQWDFEKALERSKMLTPPFAPGQAKKAHYSDTNFQLLGRIIEAISGRSLQEVFIELIFTPLGLENTYLYADAKDRRPKAFYYKGLPLHIPKAMTSFGADGGIVSTSGEMMVFLEAFFNGRLFPVEYIEELQVWNRIFFPMQSGIGIHRFKLLRIFDPFGRMPELIGHSGLSGALAFCNPKRGLYVTGTVNQLAYPDTSFRLIIKLIQRVLRR
ncbi:serine hydrolase domain-containing protein [Parapedobacter deserti]|uniref:Serine hydrolase domain-containing protein n=1 Tax=Parapedobacter deserti TaxID=1912957 RepID=A0ABV7JHN3_9SPHI